MSISERHAILVIVGPTASGKSELAVNLGKWLKRHGRKAEIISADSRQVYRGLNIGTAKIPGRWRIANGKWRDAFGKRRYVYRGITHHLIDFVSPKRTYSPAEYTTAARKILHKLFAIGHIPIICGGSGQYIDALLGAHFIPDVPPDAKLRKRFDKLTAEQLFGLLRKLDPRRAKTIDRHNPRRLIRALEIVMKTGMSSVALAKKDARSVYSNVLKIGLNPPAEELRRRINARLARDLRRGLVAEVKKLHNPPAGGGLSWKRLDELGLEYRLVARHMRGLMTRDQLLATLQRELWHYAKRQLRWWKHDKSIVCARNEREALNEVVNFLKKR